MTDPFVEALERVLSEPNVTSIPKLLRALAQTEDARQSKRDVIFNEAAHIIENCAKALTTYRTSKAAALDGWQPKSVIDQPKEPTKCKGIKPIPKELEDEVERIKQEDEEVAYVQERRESIRRGARRAPKKFRL